MFAFVYGSLKRGYSNHHWMEGASFVAEVETQPLYRLHDYGGFPALVESEEGLSIKGELYEVTEEIMTRLDVLECVEEGLYARGMVKLERPEPQSETLTYFYLRSLDGLPDCGQEWIEGFPYWEE